jgi:hypothetical protein
VEALRCLRCPGPMTIRPLLLKKVIVNKNDSCVSLPLKRVPESLRTPPSVLTPGQSLGMVLQPSML